MAIQHHLLPFTSTQNMHGVVTPANAEAFQPNCLLLNQQDTHERQVKLAPFTWCWTTTIKSQSVTACSCAAQLTVSHCGHADRN